MREGGTVIPDDGVPGAVPALLSLVFAPGRRPRADDVAELVARTPGFQISHRPPDHEGWLELLINGLTFDLTGLAPAAPAAPPPARHCLAVAADVLAAGEAIALAPGPHLAAGRALPPVIRGAAALGAALAGLAGAEAGCWHPARSGVAREPFVRAIGAWLGGGPFPAFVLAALYVNGGGSLRSEGLALLTMQELLLEQGDSPPGENAKLAVRLIDRLACEGRVTTPLAWQVDGFGEVSLEPSAAGDIVRAWRRSS